MTHRFFVPPDAIAGDRVTFGPETAHQLRNVLRLRPGAQVTALDGTGTEYVVTLTALERDVAAGRIIAQQLARTEPRVSLTLYLCWIKGERFEWVLQKGTELGVSRFVPVLSERTVLRDPRRLTSKRPRWERIIREAAEQSARGRLPLLSDVLSFPEACREGLQGHDLVLLPWERAEGEPILDIVRHWPSPLEKIALVVGPEGGFSPAEAAEAEAQGVRVVTMGPRILRAETAGVVAVALALSELGEMG